jgi:hypothetical protein
LENIRVDSVDRIFGYALPGYMLTLLAMFLFEPYLHIDFNSVALAGFLAIAGLPIGFLWVYLVYQKLLWHRGSEQWRDFCLGIVNGLLESPGAASRIQDSQLAELKKNESEDLRFHITDGFFANLQNKYPFMAFYHVKHHTIRDLGWIVFLVPMARIIIDRLAYRLTALPVWLFLGLAALTFAFALVIADKELRTAERQFAYLASQESENLLIALNNASKKPFVAILQQKDL